MQAQVNEPLRQLLSATSALREMAQKTTPSGAPTVAGQVEQQAQQMLQPQQAPQPPQGLPGLMPGAQGGEFQQQMLQTLAAQAQAQAQAQPPQAPQQPPMMAAEGGLMSLPADNMARLAYSNGGVIGFASDGYVDPETRTAEEAQAEEQARMLRSRGPQTSEEARMEMLRRIEEMRQKSQQPIVRTPDEEAYRQALSGEYTRGIGAIDESKRMFEANKQRRLEQMEADKGRDIARFLRATGGAPSLAAGFRNAGNQMDRLYAARTAESQKFDAEELAFMDKLGERRAAMENMRISGLRSSAEEARSNAANIRKMDFDLNKMVLDIGGERAKELALIERDTAKDKAEMVRLERQITATAEENEKNRRATKEIEELRRRIGPKDLTELDRAVEVKYQELVASGKPATSVTKWQAYQAVLPMVKGATASTQRARLADQQAANEWFRTQTYTDSILKTLKKGSPQYENRLEELRTQAEMTYGVRPAGPAPSDEPTTPQRKPTVSNWSNAN